MLRTSLALLSLFLLPTLATAQVSFLEETLDPVEYPVIERSGLAMPVEAGNPDDPVCRDNLRVVTDDFLPGSTPYAAYGMPDGYAVSVALLRSGVEVRDDIGEAVIRGDVRRRQTALGTIYRMPGGTVLATRSHSASWRGNSGALFIADKLNWEDIDWNALGEPGPELTRLDGAVERDAALLALGFEEVLESFVGPDIVLIGAPDGRVFVRDITHNSHRRRFTNRSSYHSSYALRQITAPDSDGDRLRLVCRPIVERFDTTPRPGLEAFLETLALIHGEPVEDGTLRSSYRSKNNAITASKILQIAPWNVEPGRSTPETVAVLLESWSWKDAWTRHKWLNLQDQYAAALADMTELMRSALIGAPDADIDTLSRQALQTVTTAHFIFPSAYAPLKREDARFLASRDPAVSRETQEAVWRIMRGVPDAPIPDIIRAARRNDTLNRMMFKSAPAPMSGSEATHRVVTATLFNPQSFAQLIEKGEALEAPNWFGKTPLMVAAHIDHADGVRALIEAKVDVSGVTAVPISPDNVILMAPSGGLSGGPRLPRSALDYALENAGEDTIRALLDAGAARAPGSPASRNLEAVLKSNAALDESARGRFFSQLPPETADPR